MSSTVRVDIPDGQTNLLDKTVGDLQEGVSLVDTNVVSGTLKKIDRFPEFWGGDADEHLNGHYLVFKVEDVDLADSVKVSITESITKKPVTLESDGICCMFIQNNSQVITIDHTKEGKSVKRKLSLSKLELQK